MKLAVRIFVVCTIIMFSGCVRKYSYAELSGRYQLRSFSGVDTIEIKIDKTYTHKYSKNDGQKAEQSGNWEVETMNSVEMVVLSRFEPLLGEQTNGMGIYLLKVENHWGKIYLITNIDQDVGYERQR